ncbi:unnamed protein product [Rangifer tarandus platyrhynchus]|uniref:Uncharacterized protein n=2 Tax=Rangifer tarandus platyrhynchus TaxID=3082113 RepID=A0ACB0DU75_RANTA|nr:unnamed protein product [Rangifer tarandus platyrhynchus]CAI9691768.1 unnamed protein product [Rangifer tarandus platyrhynchus]
MQGRTWGLRLLLLLGSGLGSQEALPPPCESQIYCHGELLHQVQMAKLYQDDKQFVDMPLSLAPDQVLRRFRELAQAHNLSIPWQELQVFIQEHFRAVGQELQPWTPGDWRDRYNPGRATGEGPLLRAAPLNPVGVFQPPVSAEDIEPQAVSLGRAAAPTLEEAGKEGTSALSLAEGEGGGEGVKPEVLIHPKQFSLIYSRYPFIVPSGRFVEFYYWDSYWMMEGLLLSEMPETVKGMLQNFLDLVQTYGHIPNGARVYYLQWSQPPLLTLMTDRYVAHTNDTAFLRKLVPVDLNAFLCQAEGLMSNFYSRLGARNDSEAAKYRNLRAQRMAALKDVLWDEGKGAWFDYDLENDKKKLEFYPSNFAPLWAGCFSDSDDVDKALKYLEDSRILTCQYGIPTSLQKTGQQWDFPNAWAPLQDLVIRGLAKSPSAKAQEVAFQLAQNWIQTNFDVYSKKSAMYEKYDISNGGQPSGGGEYEVQEGFGWTSGVALMLLDRYGDRLSSGAQTAFLEPHCLAAALLLSLLPQRQASRSPSGPSCC